MLLRITRMQLRARASNKADARKTTGDDLRAESKCTCSQRWPFHSSLTSLCFDPHAVHHCPFGCLPFHLQYRMVAVLPTVAALLQDLVGALLMLGTEYGQACTNAGVSCPCRLAVCRLASSASLATNSRRSYATCND